MTLRLDRLSSGHGGGTHLHHINLCAPPGAVHALVGHNGAGKTTLLNTIAGLLPATTGTIRLAGTDLTSWPVHRRARAGIGYVPQGARVFPSLTVAEHLTISHRKAIHTDSKAWNPQHVLELLPQLAARQRHRAGHLSGGERQMLAIARALLTQPRILLLDEPTEGLAPTVASQILSVITTLAGDGIAVLLATPQPDLAAATATRVTVLIAGRADNNPAHTTPPGTRQHRPRPALSPDLTQRTTVAAARQPEPAWADLLTTDPARATPIRPEGPS